MYITFIIGDTLDSPMDGKKVTEVFCDVDDCVIDLTKGVRPYTLSYWENQELHEFSIDRSNDLMVQICVGIQNDRSFWVYHDGIETLIAQLIAVKAKLGDNPIEIERYFKGVRI